MGSELIGDLAVIALAVLLITRQRLFVTPRGTEEQIRKRRGDMRKLGWLLLGAGILMAVGTLGSR